MKNEFKENWGPIGVDFSSENIWYRDSWLVAFEKTSIPLKKYGAWFCKFCLVSRKITIEC